MKNSAKVSTQSFVPFCLVAILILFGSLLTSTLPVEAQAPVAGSPAIEAKAQAMLAKLTLEQKIQLIGGVDGMFTNAIPSINLPRFKMSDASVGVRTWGPTTAYAGGVALAATWDTQLRARTRREPRKRRPRAQRQLPAWPRRQHRSLACQRPKFRIPLRRSRSLMGNLSFRTSKVFSRKASSPR